MFPQATNGAHLDTTTAGPRTVPVRSGLSGVKTLELSRIPRPSDVLRAGTARAPVVVSDAPHPTVAAGRIASERAYALGVQIARKVPPVPATTIHRAESL